MLTFHRIIAFHNIKVMDSPDAITYLTVDNTVYVIFQFGCDRRKMLLISISEKFAESVLEFRV